MDCIREIYIKPLGSREEPFLLGDLEMLEALISSKKWEVTEYVLTIKDLTATEL